MIYTLTFNPSLDYILTVPDFTCGIVNRTTEEVIFPGGKGVNVSMVLNNLGVENTALGFLAGFTGDKLKEMLEEKGIRTEFLPIRKGMTNQRKAAFRAGDGDQRAGTVHRQGGYRKTLWTAGPVKRRRYVNHGRQHSRCDAGNNVHGYYGTFAREEPENNRGRYKRSFGKCFTVPPFSYQTEQS